MGIYYYAVDTSLKQYFSAPAGYAIKSPGIFHPENPFPAMMVMMNVYGCHFKICNDCSSDVSPDNDYEDVTEKVYKQYLEEWNQTD